MLILLSIVTTALIIVISNTEIELNGTTLKIGSKLFRLYGIIKTMQSLSIVTAFVGLLICIFGGTIELVEYGATGFFIACLSVFVTTKAL